MFHLQQKCACLGHLRQCALCRQEGVTGAIAAGSYLEQLASAAPAQPNLAPAVQLLSLSLARACSACQTTQGSCAPAGQAPIRSDAGTQQCCDAPAELQSGCVPRRDALAVACCQTWQVRAAGMGRVQVVDLHAACSVFWSCTVEVFDVSLDPSLALGLPVAGIAWLCPGWYTQPPGNQGHLLTSTAVTASMVN